MIFGNLSSVLENDETLYQAVERTTRVNEAKAPSKWSSLLTNISHYGMNYNKKIYNNRFVIPQKIREIYGLTNGIFLKIEPYYTGMDDGFSVVYDEKMSDIVRKTIEKIYYS